MKKAVVRETSNLLRRYGIVAGICWTVVVVISLILNAVTEEKEAMTYARAEVVGAFNKDLVYRRWAAIHGGVYVPVSESVQPNPRLDHIEERDLTTPSGKQLTLINPAYMTRQVHELGLEQYGLRGHITSLRPLRPENAPDRWEAGALLAFERGVPEVVEVAEIEGVDHLRFMRPLFVEKGCLKCHEEQGYKVGDIRGGISVSTPMVAHQLAGWQHMRQLLFLQGGLWLLGILGVYVATTRLIRRTQDRDRARKSQRETEQHFQIIFEGAQEGILVVERGVGEIRDANTALREMLGYSPEAFASLALEDLVPEQRPDDESPGLDQLFRGSVRFLAAVPLRTRQGKTIRADVSGTAMDLGGQPCVVGMFREVTERLALEDRLRVSQRMESVGRVAGGVAHDFNNLLMVILGHASLLKDECERQPGDSGRSIGFITDAAKSATRLTKQLIAFSGRGPRVPELLDARQIIGELVKMLQRLVGSHITLEHLTVEALWKYVGDRGQLEQIVMNLVVNARDAMPRGGQILVETTNVQLTELEGRTLEYLPAGEYVRIAVSDTGAGIDEQTLPEIFEPFFTTKAPDRGTGLGLATVYGVVKQGGGGLRVSSVVGEGSCFEVFFPRDEGRIPLREEKTKPSATRARKREGTILVVDDQPPLLNTISLMLKRSGFNVMEAADGDAAFTWFQAHADETVLVLTDVVMGATSGKILVDRIRAAGSEVPVIFMSGFTEAVLVDFGFSVADLPILAKPFSAVELLEAVTEALERR